jgi:excisionase family DNA binding protein
MPADPHPQLKLLTPDELAELLRISKISVYRLVEQRKIPFYRVRGNLRFEPKDVMSFLRQNRVEPVGLK